MRQKDTSNGLTVRAIAGTHNIMLGFDLTDGHQQGCLGFTIARTDLGTLAAPIAAAQQQPRILPNLLRFPHDTHPNGILTDRAPVQKFRWGDYTTLPGHRYRYAVTAQYGTWDHLQPGATAQVDITTEDPTAPATAVFFNRGAASSEAYVAKFGNTDPGTSPAAQAWLSRGLEEALLAYLAQAVDARFTLHAAIYEFQKPELIQGLSAAIDRGATVHVVFHDRNSGDKDTTWKKNEAAIAANAGLARATVTPRKADPQGAISHNKFVVLLKDNVPLAVWTGSTNWTDGALYGQLNVGHAVYDPTVANIYERYFQKLSTDPSAADMKAFLANLTPVPTGAPPTGITPIFSPQPNKNMLKHYAAIALGAKCLLVCAPFALAQEIRDIFPNVPTGTLRYLLLDQEDNIGDKQQVQVIEGKPGNEVSVATSLSSPLHDFQNKLLEDRQSFHHPGIHIHAKVIAADPFSDDPIIVTGSANFSTNSTMVNDSNSLIVHGNTAVADIYATEFMRMFDHYRFRGVRQKAQDANQPLGLKEDDSWTIPYYTPADHKMDERLLFAGTGP